MILVDANLLIYAKCRGLPQHQAAQRWLDERLNAPVRVGLPWVVLLAFARIVTNSRVFERPFAFQRAWEQVLDWLALPNVWVPEPTDRHGDIVAELAEVTTISSRLVADVHLAALAVEHGLTLCSSDGDFALFPQVRWENPLRG